MVTLILTPYSIRQVLSRAQSAVLNPVPSMPPGAWLRNWTKSWISASTLVGRVDETVIMLSFILSDPCPRGVASLTDGR